jgi:hypothetical protein
VSRGAYKRGDVIRWRDADGTVRQGVFRRWGSSGRASIGVTKAESSSGWWIGEEQIVEPEPKRGEESGT